MPEFLSPLAYLYVIPVLGFMILIHEFGHFAVAKLLGVSFKLTLRPADVLKSRSRTFVGRI
jgi:hypothetical protein